MEMDFSIDLFIYAFDKKTENDLFEMWKLQFPQMDKDTFIPFTDYKKAALKKAKTHRKTKITYEEIEKEMGEVIKQYEERR